MVRAFSKTAVHCPLDWNFRPARDLIDDVIVIVRFIFTSRSSIAFQPKEPFPEEDDSSDSAQTDDSDRSSLPSSSFKDARKYSTKSTTKTYIDC